jgi:GTPase SAR1 family protein
MNSGPAQPTNFSRSSSFFVNENPPFSSADSQTEDTIKIASDLLSQINAGLETFAQEHHGVFPEKSVVMLGNTGSGKTTLIHALAGSELRSNFNDSTGMTSVTAHPEIPGFEIGKRRTSQTTIPRVCSCIDSATQRSVPVFDFPGLEENRSLAQEIVNAISMQKVLAIASNIHILVLIQANDILENRALSIMKFLSVLEEILSDHLHAFDSISLVVTQAEQQLTETQVKNNLKNIVDDLNVGTNKRHLIEVLSQKIAIFRKASPVKGALLNTAETVQHVFKNIYEKGYGKTINFRLGLSVKAKHEVHKIYAALSTHISEKIRGCVKTLRDSVTDFIKTHIQNSKKPEERKVSQNALQDFLNNLKSFVNSEDSIKTILEKYEEIVRKISPGFVNQTDVLRKVELATSLKQFIDTPNSINDSVVSSMNNAVQACCSEVETALMEIRAMDAADEASAAQRRATRAEELLDLERERNNDFKTQLILGFFEATVATSQAAVNGINRVCDSAEKVSSNLAAMKTIDRLQQSQKNSQPYPRASGTKK